MNKRWILSFLLLLLVAAGCATSAEPLQFPAVTSGSEGGLYPPQDLSLIANTGRVQMLDIYANW